jgi:hypothetical protein
MKIFGTNHAKSIISGRFVSGPFFSVSLSMLTIPFPVISSHATFQPGIPGNLQGAVWLDFHFIQADRGRIFRQNPDKSLQSFTPCYSQSPSTALP